MTNQQSYINNRNKSSNCVTCIILSIGYICISSLIAAVICFYVFGIKYLIQDYNTSQECKSSNIWAYVLTGLIINFSNSKLKNILDEDGDFNISAIIVSLTLNFAMAIWGGIEIYYLNCPDLENTNISQFAFVMFIIYTIITFIIILILLYTIFIVCSIMDVGHDYIKNTITNEPNPDNVNIKPTIEV